MFANNQGLAEELRQGEGSTSQKANSVLAVMVGASVELGQGKNLRRIWRVPRNLGLLSTPLALTHMINILLDQSDVAQALLATDKADVLEGYVTEMLRLDPPVQGIYREATVNETIGSTSINAGDLIYLDVSSASRNVSSVARCRYKFSHCHLGACVCGTHEDRSLSAQGKLHPR